MSDVDQCSCLFLGKLKNTESFFDKSHLKLFGKSTKGTSMLIIEDNDVYHCPIIGIEKKDIEKIHEYVLSLFPEK